MDIFNKNKVKELERKIERLESELEIYREKEKENQNKRHKTGVWCQGCKNLIINPAIGYFSAQFCMLDNECKDREA